MVKINNSFQDFYKPNTTPNGADLAEYVDRIAAKATELTEQHSDLPLELDIHSPDIQNLRNGLDVTLQNENFKCVLKILANGALSLQVFPQKKADIKSYQCRLSLDQQERSPLQFESKLMPQKNGILAAAVNPRHALLQNLFHPGMTLKLEIIPFPENPAATIQERIRSKLNSRLN